MARKATAATADDLPVEMDYAQHNTTYAGFLSLVRWTIAGLFLVVLALYSFIEGRQPILGTLLLLAIPVGAVVIFVMKSRTAD